MTHFKDSSDEDPVPIIIIRSPEYLWRKKFFFCYNLLEHRRVERASQYENTGKLNNGSLILLISSSFKIQDYFTNYLYLILCFQAQLLPISHYLPMHILLD
jgi:hypothetical protein